MQKHKIKSLDQIMDSAQDSIGFVSIITDDDQEIPYKGFLYDNSCNLVSYTGKVFHEAKKFLIHMPSSIVSIEPLEAHYDVETGVCCFRLPTNYVITSVDVSKPKRPKRNSTLLIPHFEFYSSVMFLRDGNAIPIIKGSINYLLVDHMLSEADYGCPVLNYCGEIVGVVGSGSSVTEEDRRKVIFMEQQYRKKLIDDRCIYHHRDQYLAKLAVVIPVSRFPLPFQP